MSFDGRAVANFALDLCAARGRGITNLSLQKIVYFCHVWSLIKLNRPLLKHQFEAWQYGPVLQYLYREFRAFESAPIVGRAKGIDPETGKKLVVAYVFDQQTEALLTEMVDFYSRLSASELVKLSHVRGGPWDTVWNHDGHVNPGMKIEDTIIAAFYAKARAPFPIQ
jgi:uncharacterized phage-associated protein